MKTDLIHSEVEKFAMFLVERQEIWYRRYKLKLPQEGWTADPILKCNNFCNVYRQLDRTTKYAITNILRRGDARSRDILFNTELSST